MRRERGFTLVELVAAIVVFGVIAATLTVFYRPAFESWLATRQRAELAAAAGLALQRLAADVRASVPNAIRTPSADCIETLPTRGGGRYRRAPDTVADSAPGCTPGATCSAPLDTTQATTVFDVLTPMATVPAVGDFVVVANQSPNDVHAGANRAAITAVEVPNAAYGRHRLTVQSTAFPSGYDGGRFVVVPASQRAVFYVCSGADGTLDARGAGKGTLFRLANYGFVAAYPTACPSTAGAPVLATGVRSCRFVHDANQGATQQNGHVSMQIELARGGETASLVVGVHVVNAP